MMLRSSSTPILESLLSSISEGPNNNNNHIENKHPLPPTTIHHHKKPGFHQPGSVNLTSVSRNSSPITPSVGHSYNGFRRAQSEGNLEVLAYASRNSDDDFHNSKHPKKCSGKTKYSVLETIPSFSCYNSRGRYQDEEKDSEEFEEDDSVKEEKLVAVSALKNSSLEMVKEKEFVGEYSNVGYDMERNTIGSQMYLARGLGINDGGFGSCGGGGGGGGGGFHLGYSGNGAGDGDYNPSSMEEYFKRRVEENPGNPLFLRNYAHFLYQTKKDLQGAEEYYSRAILADPKDGDILSQYAKLIWERHGDEPRALSYFERAVQASPEDSHVHAAYANFIWEIEDDEENVTDDLGSLTPVFHGTMASASA